MEHRLGCGRHGRFDDSEYCNSRGRWKKGARKTISSEEISIREKTGCAIGARQSG
jgi:hypothetical protein